MGIWWSNQAKNRFCRRCCNFLIWGWRFGTGERIIVIPTYPSFPIYLPALLLILLHPGLFQMISVFLSWLPIVRQSVSLQKGLLIQPAF